MKNDAAVAQPPLSDEVDLKSLIVVSFRILGLYYFSVLFGPHNNTLVMWNIIMWSDLEHF